MSLQSLGSFFNTFIHQGCIKLIKRDIKGVVHFKKKTFADNLLTPMSSKMSMSFFLQRFFMKTFQDFSP